MSQRKHITNKQTIAFLTKLVGAHGGVLLPEDVVEAARPSESPLHRYFTWDNTEAARKWRIVEAQRLLRVTVTYIRTGKKEIMHRVFCSLTSDRRQGGYRVTAEVLSNVDLRRQLLEDAREEMRFFTKKYHQLTELAAVFTAMKKALKK